MVSRENPSDMEQQDTPVRVQCHIYGVMWHTYNNMAPSETSTWLPSSTSNAGPLSALRRSQHPSTPQPRSSPPRWGSHKKTLECAQCRPAGTWPYLCNTPTQKLSESWGGGAAIQCCTTYTLLPSVEISPVTHRCAVQTLDWRRWY